MKTMPPMLKRSLRAAESGSHSASILVGLLWCLALLAVVVIGALHTANLDLRVVKNHGDSIQAHYLALAGIEKAKALLYREAKERKRAGQNHSGQLYNAPDQFRDVRFGRGQFRVIRQGSREEGGKIVYGISDEESRLNVNKASAEELARLRGMTPDVVASIADWRDTDNNVTENGAESEYYLSQNPPYLMRNGPIETVRELLMVRGVSREMLLGEDANQNGLLDREEDDGKESYPPDNRDGILDPGWSGLLTVDSQNQNVNAAGDDRVNVQTADETALTGVRGITPEIAKAIVAFRGQRKFETLDDLLEVTPPGPANNRPGGANPGSPNPQPGGDGAQLFVNAGPGNNSGSPNPQPDGDRAQPFVNAGPGNNPGSGSSGQKLIDETLFTDIADDVTVADGETQPGLVNVNTAAFETLYCLPGITEELAQAVVSYRSSSGYLANVAHLLKVPGMTRPIFKQIAPRVTVRSETFRIVGEGVVLSSGARKRIEVVVRLGASEIETLAYREDL